MWVKKYLENKFGDPIKDIENYEKQSSYSMRETDGGNAKYLIEMPLRIYHEMDPMWYIKERCKTISDSHLVVTTSLVNYLYQNRNKNAEIIISLNRGKRADGRRHPHSWSIVDEKDCLQWLLHFLE